jgi:DNA-directed RNA polymerase specialized sigma24 family protein
MQPATRKQLREADWEDIGVRLTAYAMWKARNYRWRTGQVWALAAGNTPEDVAREAIMKVLDGSRAWEPARGPLLPYLEGVVDSLMSHLAGSTDNVVLKRWHDRAPEPAARDAGDGADVDIIERLRTTLHAQQANDLLAILDVVQVSGATPRAIALALRTSVKDVNNRLKRLRRAALRVLHEYPRQEV